ncbi:thioredoxin domain-containing protein [Agrococcus sp. ProA11]|uniref:DsbA family protein n=1 Tax=Agrococcus chionoecetis TaxID=3153752 RepID=UPI003260D142
MPTRPVAVISIIAIAAAILVAAMLLVVRPWESSGSSPATEESPDSTASPSALPPLVDESTHILNDAGPDAPVVVEFLDFECEVCGAVYPTMEGLREEYDGEVTFAVRYFPLPGHFNSGNAAVAVEAAAQQGAFEAMYQRMFETQSEWGEGRESEADRFRGYAQELGLDMAAYDAGVADPATLARVEQDFQAGVALGVDRTPTIFVDGERLELSQESDIETAIQAALAG